MAKKLKIRPTAWAFAVAAWDIYRRLPPKQRQQAFRLATKHGPKLAKQIAKKRGGSKKK